MQPQHPADESRAADEHPAAAERRAADEHPADDERLAAYRRRRWGCRDEWAAWLQPAALAALQPQQAAALYRAAGGRETARFRANDIEALRDSLDFLLYDTIKLEGRFDECAADTGAYKLAGAGKEFVSYLLCLHQPRLFCVWNANAERLLRAYGQYPPAMRQGPVGIRYLDCLDAAARLSATLGLRDFQEFDEAAWLNARRPSARR